MPFYSSIYDDHIRAINTVLQSIRTLQPREVDHRLLRCVTPCSNNCTVICSDQAISRGDTNLVTFPAHHRLSADYWCGIPPLPWPVNMFREYQLWLLLIHVFQRHCYILWYSCLPSGASKRNNPPQGPKGCWLQRVQSHPSTSAGLHPLLLDVSMVLLNPQHRS